MTNSGPLQGRKASLIRKMGICKKTEGQTIVETAIILVLLLLVLLAITEFARAWFTKNSLKNAVRHGVRIAVVTDGITPEPEPTYVECGVTCPSAEPATDQDIIAAVCCSPGVRNDGTTEVSLTYTDDNGDGVLDTGDTITVGGRTAFDSVVSGSFFPWLQDITLTTDASMRYE